MTKSVSICRPFLYQKTSGKGLPPLDRHVNVFFVFALTISPSMYPLISGFPGSSIKTRQNKIKNYIALLFTDFSLFFAMCFIKLLKYVRVFSFFLFSLFRSEFLLFYSLVLFILLSHFYSNVKWKIFFIFFFKGLPKKSALNLKSLRFRTKRKLKGQTRWDQTKHEFAE